MTFSPVAKPLKTTSPQHTTKTHSTTNFKSSSGALGSVPDYPSSDLQTAENDEEEMLVILVECGSWKLEGWESARFTDRENQGYERRCVLGVR